MIVVVSEHEDGIFLGKEEASADWIIIEQYSGEYAVTSGCLAPAGVEFFKTGIRSLEAAYAVIKDKSK